MMETVTNKTLEKLKYDLVRTGLVPYETLEQAQEIANAQNINIGQALINSGVLTEETLIKFLENKLHTPFVNLEDYKLDTKCLKYVNYKDAKKYGFGVGYIYTHDAPEVYQQFLPDELKDRKYTR